MDLHVLATQILASGSSDSDATSWAWLLLLSGPVFYGLMYLRYRNADKRHKHESETRATLHDVRAADQFHRSLTGLSNSRMQGANNHAVRGAQGPGGIPGMLGKLGQDALGQD
jgi:hypothetical protein